MSIVIENLSHIYMKGSPFEKVALNDINLRIGEEEFVAIIGPTGSGKSTLVQHFNGLLKPTQGRIIVNDIEVTGSNLKELRRQVGIVFQYPEHQLFEETVYKDIAFGLHKQGLDTKEIDKRIRKTIKMVGLNEDILEKSPFELSGGQKRRVAIAGVLVMNPKILVLDEPTAGLDPKGRDEIFSFILQLYKEMHMTIILVSHSMEDVARLAKRVIVMYKGKIAMDGYPGEVFSKAEQLESMGLSAPQISYLMRKLKKIIPEINENIFTISEAKKEIMKYL
ncbi:MAG TPA: energy-coupling factor transporter ATPase [Clostridiaceae bacterium]|nr:energy-coupling factor transporter ATPase [Clostridiaceae bacterium]